MFLTTPENRFDPPGRSTRRRVCASPLLETQSLSVSTGDMSLSSLFFGLLTRVLTS